MAGAAGLAVAFLLWPPVGVAAQSSPRDALQTFLTFPLQNVSAAAEAPDDLFTVFFLGDPEPRMRANTNEEVRAYIENLVSYKTTKLEFFDHGGGRRHRIIPELVILAGDISADRETSVAADSPLWLPLLDSGVAVLAGFGNHDWTPRHQYSFAGDFWNVKALEFCRETYRNATRVASPYFGYREFGPTDARGPVTSVANFRGVQIVNFQSFLYQPSYHYDFESSSGQACVQARAVQGWAGCEHFSSAEPQIQQLEAALATDAGVPTLFVQHYPLTTADEWWDDYGSSGTSVAQKKQRLRDIMGRYTHKVFLAGHNHQYARRQHTAGSGTVTEYIAPYFGGKGGPDLNQGGSFLALLVSRTQGIVEVKYIPTPLHDAARSSITTSRETPTTAPTAVPPTSPVVVDLTILGQATSKALAQACVTSNCLTEALQCAGDAQCSALAEPLLSSRSDDREAMAQMFWALANAAPNNPTIFSLAQCTDNHCGSAMLTSAAASTSTATTTITMTPALRGNTSSTTALGTTTWNPWGKSLLGGCRGRGSVALAALGSALVAMGSAVLQSS